jgi:hypothetical protein
MVFEQLPPSTVADLDSLARRTDDVCKENGGENAL